jgi:RNA polymerase sigma factor (sigma-70 family)
MGEEYDDKREDLDELLKKYRGKWQLNALAWLDYDDVCQIIRIHIYKKWHLWDQERPFKPWAAMIISNQIKNLVRNNYTSFARPCLRCPHNMGNTACSLTKSREQDTSCLLFAKWKKKKERAYNIKLPLSLDDAVAVSSTTPSQDHLNYADSATKLHKLVIEHLNDKHKQIYIMLYIQNEDENKIAEKFGFKADSSKRKKPRYKQMANLKKKFYILALKIIKENDIV